MYTSDTPGRHDYALLRDLVLPDGTVPVASRPGTPTVDSLFQDPSVGCKAFKIVNFNDPVCPVSFRSGKLLWPHRGAVCGPFPHSDFLFFSRSTERIVHVHCNKSFPRGIRVCACACVRVCVWACVVCLHVFSFPPGGVGGGGGLQPPRQRLGRQAARLRLPRRRGGDCGHRRDWGARPWLLVGRRRPSEIRRCGGSTRRARRRRRWSVRRWSGGRRKKKATRPAGGGDGWAAGRLAGAGPVVAPQKLGERPRRP